jgi:hypothetical protein
MTPLSWNLFKCMLLPLFKGMLYFWLDMYIYINHHYVSLCTLGVPTLSKLKLGYN